MGSGSAAAAPVSTGLAPGISFGALLAGVLYAVPLLGAAVAQQMYRLAIVNVLLLFLVNLWNAFPKKLATINTSTK